MAINLFINPSPFNVHDGNQKLNTYIIAAVSGFVFTQYACLFAQILNRCTHQRIALMRTDFSYSLGDMCTCALNTREK